MPINITATFNQQITIPEDTASINIRLYGGGGGGEFVDSNTLVSAAGTSGGITSFIGLNATGGQGGGIGGRNLGGAGGSASQTVNWTSLGALVDIVGGSIGGLNFGGTGGTIPGINSVNGGAGTPQGVNYSSSVTHVFNNENNTNTLNQSSPDITVSIESLGAADNLSCSNNNSYKHYRIQFNVPYDDANYTINNFQHESQAAGGSTTGPFSYSIGDKTRFGFRVWFCRASVNTYIRAFSFTTTGNRPVLLGRGGGGSGFIGANITRQQLIESSTYTPGTNHALVVGSAGTTSGASATNGGAGKAFITIVLEPRVTAFLDSPTIVRGQSTILNWVVSGDVGQVSISPGIGLVNINGNYIVSPTETTTYIITATGLGGTDTEQITLIVYQPPTVDITGPPSLDYGQQGMLTYSATNVDISFTLEASFTYKNGSLGGPMFTTNLPLGASLGDTIITQIPYNDFGPTSVTYVIVATGNGGQESKLLTIPINIDETPNNFLIPEIEGVLKSQDPVTTPDTVATSYEILINDVDIPVEVKADRPILVQINNTDIWIPIREI